MQKVLEKYKIIMSKFADIIFDVQNISLNKIYTEKNQEEKKQRILKLYKKKYWDSVFEEAEKIFRKLVSKNYKQEKYFFHQVRLIKKKGIESESFVEKTQITTERSSKFT